MIERLPELVNGNAAIVRWGRHMDAAFMLEVGDTQYLVTVRDGRVERVEQGPFVMRPWRFAIRAAKQSWDNFWMQPPPPGWHDLYALLRRGDVVFEGDQRYMMAYLLYLKLLLASPRKR